ncbi:glucosidase [Flavobacteriaceae bacterium KMM 6898]|nr:glucosidase [Flavobacteriaceae bacterium KMM 6898]
MIKEEEKRLKENYSGEKDWLQWGPYLSERQWGTVREDYSVHGDAWNYFPHDHSRLRVYRWGEDGIAGISDRYCNLCFGVALWNGKDNILKERLFGLTGPEGNHGEDVKELYYYLDNTPTHSYMKHLYKYPQKAFPYKDLVATNQKRGKRELEYELLDTGIFDKNEYFDVFTEYSKADPEDILIKITIANRSVKKAPISVLPTLWIRNFWSFYEMPKKPLIKANDQGKTFGSVDITHPYIGDYHFYFEKPDKLLFTENETNDSKIYNKPNDHPFKKDLFHDAVVSNNFKIPESKKEGTKFAPYYKLDIKGKSEVTIRLRLSKKKIESNPFDTSFEANFEEKITQADEFYGDLKKTDDKDLSNIQRQAFAGMLWTKQYYNYDVEQWLSGDTLTGEPPKARRSGRNNTWKTMRTHDILSMPDAWEYPWFAAWDLAFHCVPLAHLDAEFAKIQLMLLTKEWYMAPNGQIPAYEWNFSDVNPPVQAWAAFQVYQIDKKKTGKGDIDFLKRIFNKLALNFTWWVNQQDKNEHNVFQGGFLGLDNIGVFDRSHDIPGGGYLEQVDGTAWMALYCLNMLEISLEISLVDKAFEDMATKYLGHFVFIAEALNNLNQDSVGNWDKEEGFFYDRLVKPSGEHVPVKIRSIVGLLSLAAVLVIPQDTLDKLPTFKRSLEWFRNYRMYKSKYRVIQTNSKDGVLLSLVSQGRFKVLMKTLLDEKEFLSDYGIRALSKIHEQKTYTLTIDGIPYSIDYEPAESTVSLFGGNSNWRGPIWFPINYMFIESLLEYHAFFGGDMRMEYPTGSNNNKDLKELAEELGKRLVAIFQKDKNGNRPVNALHKTYYQHPKFEDLVLFYEYFHGDNGRGVGASHQTGWTGLVANLIYEFCDDNEGK